MAGKRLDLSDEGSSTPAGPARGNRPYLGIRFQCCGAYARIYRDASADAYVGRCPRCARPVTIRIGPGGSTSRFFEVH